MSARFTDASLTVIGRRGAAAAAAEAATAEAAAAKSAAAALTPRARCPPRVPAPIAAFASASPARLK